MRKTAPRWSPWSIAAATWLPCAATTTSVRTTPWPRSKAYTALSSKTPTRLFAERAASTPDAANLNTLDELLLLGGGVPLKVGDEVIGAIGVAGAGGAKNDEACAVAAIEKLLPSSH